MGRDGIRGRRSANEYVGVERRISNGQHRRKQIFVLGGVSGDSRISADAIRFSGWQETALAAELPIKFYTTLEQMGLSDADMAEDDFVENLAKINGATANNHCLVIINDSLYPHFANAIIKQLKDDGIDYSSASYQNYTFKMERAADAWGAIKVELFQDVFLNKWLRGDSIVGWANQDGGEALKWYAFQKVAKVQPVVDITPLNGWAFTDFKLGKVGNCAVFTFTTKKSENIKTNGTVIAKFPVGYRPKIGIAFSAIANTSKHNARFVVRPSGEVAVYDVDDSVYVIDCSGVFFTD